MGKYDLSYKINLQLSKNMLVVCKAKRLPQKYKSQTPSSVPDN